MLEGPSSGDVQEAIQHRTGGFFGLGDAYLDFANNHAFEKTEGLGGSDLGAVCKLDVSFLNNGYLPLGLEAEDPITTLEAIQYQLV